MTTNMPRISPIVLEVVLDVLKSKVEIVTIYMIMKATTTMVQSILSEV